MKIHYLTVQVIDNPRTSQEIRLARLHHGLKQEELASAIGVSRSFVTQIENGQRDISVYLAQRIKTYFDSLDQAAPQCD
jgi:transcriptional regulator with XRE-family HTH domain